MKPEDENNVVKAFEAVIRGATALWCAVIAAGVIAIAALSRTCA